MENDLLLHDLLDTFVSKYIDGSSVFHLFIYWRKRSHRHKQQKNMIIKVDESYNKLQQQHPPTKNYD